MGHERTGTLPRTRNWLAVINAFGQGDFGSRAQMPTEKIARLTIDAARSKISNVQRDEGVAQCFKFLVLLAVASQQDDPRLLLSEYDVHLPAKITPLAVSLSLRDWLSQVEQNANPEYMVMARQATADAIAAWQRMKSTGQLGLFNREPDTFESWRYASRGAGFSELAELFFARFTLRYLNYFLSRVASSELSTLQQRDAFEVSMRNHVDDIATHAFETSKITQSFAAGWFNKNAIGQLPSDELIHSFIAFAFSKIQEELRREGKRS